LVFALQILVEGTRLGICFANIGRVYRLRVLNFVFALQIMVENKTDEYARPVVILSNRSQQLQSNCQEK